MNEAEASATELTPPRIERRLAPEAAELPAELPAVLRRIYAARGIRHADEIERSLSGLLAPQEMGGADAAAGLIADVIERYQAQA